MTQNTGRIDRGGNDVQKQGPGDMIMDQKKIHVIAGAGAQPITAEAILSGIVERTGPVGAYADTWPAADTIMAACPALDRGDAFEFLVRNGVAFDDTTAVVANSGVTLVRGVITASLVKRFMLTVLGAGRAVILPGVAANGSAVVSLLGAGMTPSQAASAAQKVQPGMLVTGTHIPGGTSVLGVNSVTGSVTLSANASGTGATSLTFTPHVEIRGLYQAAE